MSGSEPRCPNHHQSPTTRCRHHRSVRVVDRQAHDRRVVTITIILQIKVVRREGHSVGADVVVVVIR